MSRNTQNNKIAEQQDVQLDLICDTQGTAFVIDTSGSMSHNFNYQCHESRMSVAKRALVAILNKRQEVQDKSKDLMGVFQMGNLSLDDVKVLAEIGYVNEASKSKVRKLNARGGTPMLRALKQASDALLRSNADLLRIVLITDGSPNTGGTKEDVLGFARDLFNKEGVMVDTIGIGSSDYGEYDPDFLKELSACAGGTFIEVDRPENLIDILMEKESERRVLMGQGIRLLPAVASQ